MRGGFVGSPISEEDARGLSDDDWLSAFDTYSSNSPSDDWDDFPVGGAHQLSKQLEDLVREDPPRFAQLVLRMSDDSNPAFFEAILRGIAGADIDPAAIIAACLRCHDVPRRPLGRWITQPLADVTESPLPEEALEMVAWYATQDADPDAQASCDQTYYQFGREFTRYEPVHYGINSVRGAAAISVARLIYADEHHKEFFEPYLIAMVNDPSDAVRSCVAEVLVAVWNYDQDLAVQLFVQICNSDERLLATKHFQRFLKYAGPTRFLQMEPVFSRMLSSEYQEVAEAGARWVCYASLNVEAARSLAEQCTTGSRSLRLGAAEVYAANLKNEEFRGVCEKMLLKFFEDPEAEVRQVSSRCFFNLKERGLEDYREFAEQYISSQAFEPTYNPLFDALDESDADVDEVVLLACERVLDMAGGDTGDMTTAVAATSHVMAKLIARVYEGAADPSIRARCLDIIDRMTQYSSYGLEDFIARHTRGSG